MKFSLTRQYKSNRIFPAVAAAVAAALVLASCAGGGTGGSTEPGPEEDSSSSGDKVTLNFWNGFTGPDGPALEKVVEDFNASQDEVEVKVNIMPWDTLYQKVLTSVASSGGPDIIAMSASRMPQFANEGLFAEIDDFYADPANETDALVEAAAEATIFDGKYYGVPVNFATMLMYYNKDLFEAAGLDPEAPPTTWDEFAAMVPNLTVDENGDGVPEQYALAVADHETVPVFPSFLWNTGGGIVSADGKISELDSPESLKALNFWIDLIREEKASPIGLSGADADKLFQTQKAAIEIVGPWMTTGFNEAGINFGLAPVFAGPDGQYTLADVVTMGVPENVTDEKRSASYKFFAYWNSQEGQITWADGSGFPPTRADVADQLTNEYAAIFGAPEIAENSRVLMPGLAAGGTIMETIFNPSLQKALNGQGTVDDIFTAASKQVQAELDK